MKVGSARIISMGGRLGIPWALWGSRRSFHLVVNNLPRGQSTGKELQGGFLAVHCPSLWGQAPSHLGDEEIFHLQLDKTQTWIHIVFKSRSRVGTLTAGDEETWALGPPLCSPAFQKKNGNTEVKLVSDSQKTLVRECLTFSAFKTCNILLIFKYIISQ